MAYDLLKDPVIIFMIAMAVIGYLIYYFVSRKNQKEFKSVPFHETVQKDIKMTLKRTGKACNGKLKIGYQTIGFIDRFLVQKGKFPFMEYDQNNKTFRHVHNNDSNFNLLLLRTKSDNFFIRMFLSWFGVGYQYFILNNSRIVYNDPINNIWVLQDNEYVIPYGNIWINSDHAMEYLDDISMKSSKESIMTHMENYADRIVHLEIKTARENQLKRADAQIQKERWESAKRIDENVIT